MNHKNGIDAAVWEIQNILHGPNRSPSPNYAEQTLNVFEPQDEPEQSDDGEAITKFEGCNRDGLIKCIFIGEFHHTAGPKILEQVPSNFISKDTFDAASVYIIPKSQLQRSILTVSLDDLKILGYPVMIKNNRYMRNEFYFNLCFVFDVWSRSLQFESVVKKLAEFLVCLEEKHEYLSKPETPEQVQRLLTHILHELNETGTCILNENNMISYLKVIKVPPDPPDVRDDLVPILLPNQQEFDADEWDLTTYQIYPYIDGYNHIARIAAESDVEINIVKACIRNLAYYKVVRLLPLFLYSNVYTVLPYIRKLLRDPDIRQRCVHYVSMTEDPAPYKQVLEFYSCLNRSTSVKDVCVRVKPRANNIDERKLIQFGVLERFIKKIDKFPILLKSASDVDEGVYGGLRRFFNGRRCLEELCCMGGVSVRYLEEQIARDEHVIVLSK